MVNYINKLISVNTSNLTKEEKIDHELKILNVVNQIQLGITNDMFFFKREKALEKKGWATPKKDNYNINCPFSVAKDICYNTKDEEIKKGKKRKVEEKYEALYAVQEKAEEFYKLLKTEYHKVLEDMNFICIKSIKGTFISPPNEKGSPFYAKNTRRKLIRLAKVFQKFYPNAYFITLTVDLKKFSGGIIDQHKKAVEYAGQFCKDLVREIGGKYIIVNEEQKRGAIHFHIEFFTHADLHSGNIRHTKDGKKTYIGAGRLREFCDSHWAWGHFDLQRGIGENVIFYLVKYITKKTEEDFWSLKNKKSLRGEDWKTFLGFMLPKVGGYRQWNASRLDKEMREYMAQLEKEEEEFLHKYYEFKEKERTLKNPHTRFRPLNDYVAKPSIVIKNLPKVKSLPQQSELDKAIARLRAYLIALSDNSPIPCMKVLYSGKYGDLVNKYGTDFMAINRISDKEKHKITLGCSPLGCGDCFMGRVLRDFINGKQTKIEINNHSELLKPLLWQVLPKELKEQFTSFNFGVNDTLDSDFFAWAMEQISQKITQKNLNSNLAKHSENESVKYIVQGYNLCLFDWQNLLTYYPQDFAFLGNSELHRVSVNLFGNYGKSIFNSLSPIWADSGFDEVFEDFQEWLSANGYLDNLFD